MQVSGGQCCLVTNILVFCRRSHTSLVFMPCQLLEEGLVGCIAQLGTPLSSLAFHITLSSGGEEAGCDMLREHKALPK